MALRFSYGIDFFSKWARVKQSLGINGKLPMVRLVIKKFDGKEEIIPLVKGEVRMGRNDPDAGIVNEINFTDSVVSRSHARIFFENSAYFIEDLGSVN